MRILIVSWYFPPTNTMGAMRTGKLAKYLLAQGHDVRVIAAANMPFPQTLPLEIPGDRVQYTRWVDVNGLPKAAAGLRARILGRKPALRHNPSGDGAADAGSALPRSERSRGALSRLASLYETLLNWPDSRVGWLPFALAAARKTLASWSPEVLFASAPPFTALLAGHVLSRRHGVPWVAEFRDRWWDDPYYPPTPWRRKMEAALERRIVANAAGLTTVSEPWARTYAQRYAKPTVVVYNGYDPSDYDAALCLGSPNGACLRIVYTGRIYPGRRDPSALFKALRLLEKPARVRVEFYGSQPSRILPIADRYGVRGSVQIHPHVPYSEAVRAQQAADVLLFMQWNDPREQGNVPGKLFEYLAARRPILGLGLEDGVAALIVSERAAGRFLNDPRSIADELAAWIRMKDEQGGIPALPESVRTGFSRDEQFAKLESFLYEVVGSHGQEPNRPFS
jgi:glycosyltransferase involved in cell wall biosynthesis